MSTGINRWCGELVDFVAAALDEFRTQTTEQMEQFAVDCHPWNGVLALSFLTTREVEDSPFLARSEEMAAWKFYDFASALSCRRPELASGTRELYEAERRDNAAAAELFFQACAIALSSQRAQEALSKYDLSKAFRITIPHPDTGVEYYLSP